MSLTNSGRRAFLRGDLLTREGRNQEAKKHRPLGPRPPWHADIALETTCKGCSQPCVNACEPGIVKIHPPDHSLAGTPWLDFQAGGCTFCAACASACPADINTDEKPEPVLGTAVIDLNTCIAWDDIICMSCSNRCDWNAITLTHYRRARINPEQCNGCGACVPVCPVQALSIA